MPKPKPNWTVSGLVKALKAAKCKVNIHAKEDARQQKKVARLEKKKAKEAAKKEKERVKEVRKKKAAEKMKVRKGNKAQKTTMTNNPTTSTMADVGRGKQCWHHHDGERRK